MTGGHVGVKDFKAQLDPEGCPSELDGTPTALLACELSTMLGSTAERPLALSSFAACALEPDADTSTADAEADAQELCSLRLRHAVERTAVAALSLQNSQMQELVVQQQAERDSLQAELDCARVQESAVRAELRRLDAEVQEHRRLAEAGPARLLAEAEQRLAAEVEQRLAAEASLLSEREGQAGRQALKLSERADAEQLLAAKAEVQRARAEAEQLRREAAEAELQRVRAEAEQQLRVEAERRRAAEERAAQQQTELERLRAEVQSARRQAAVGHASAEAGAEASAPVPVSLAGRGSTLAGPPAAALLDRRREERLAFPEAQVPPQVWHEEPLGEGHAVGETKEPPLPPLDTPKEEKPDGRDTIAKAPEEPGGLLKASLHPEQRWQPPPAAAAPPAGPEPAGASAGPRPLPALLEPLPACQEQPGKAGGQDGGSTPPEALQQHPWAPIAKDVEEGSLQAVLLTAQEAATPPERRQPPPPTAAAAFTSEPAALATPEPGAASATCDGGGPGSALEPFLARLEQPAEPARRVALDELAQAPAAQGDERALLAVLDRLRDPAWSVRRAAILALGRLAERGDLRVASAAVDCLQGDPHSGVRQAAVATMVGVAKRGDVPVLEAALEHLRDASGNLRLDLVEALPQLAEAGDNRTLTALEVRLCDGDWRVRSAAVVAMEELARGGPWAERALAAAAALARGDPDRRVRRKAEAVRVRLLPPAAAAAAAAAEQGGTP